MLCDEAKLTCGDCVTANYVTAKGRVSGRAIDQLTTNRTAAQTVNI